MKGQVDGDTLVEELCRFPLFSAMFGRRARRFGLGMAIPDGPLAYESRQAPVPLSDLERTILILSGGGINGWNTGMEHTASGTPDTGCNYPVRLLGRTFQSAAGIYPSELIFTDDEGTFLTQFRNLDPGGLVVAGESMRLAQVAERLKEHCVKLAPGRTTLPREMPHIDLHNLWNANQGGTTLFAPVVDLAEMLMDFLAVYLAMGFTPYDPVHKRVCGDLSAFAGAGLIDDAKRFSIIDFEQYCLAAGAVELGLICQNIVLAEQAMGLGGWLFSGINPHSLMGAFSSDGIKGMGFRFTTNPEWSLPNPVGVDGYFEGLCPPYHPDMHAAAAKFAEKKFGRGGTYDPARPGPFKDSPAVKARVDRYSAEFVELLGTVGQYLYEAFGRFPATVPTIFMRIYAQAHHADLDFYRKFYGPNFFLDTHEQHMARWHGK